MYQNNFLQLNNSFVYFTLYSNIDCTFSLVSVLPADAVRVVTAVKGLFGFSCCWLPRYPYFTAVLFRLRLCRLDLQADAGQGGETRGGEGQQGGYGEMQERAARDGDRRPRGTPGGQESLQTANRLWKEWWPDRGGDV